MTISSKEDRDRINRALRKLERTPAHRNDTLRYHCGVFFGCWQRNRDILKRSLNGDCDPQLMARVIEVIGCAEVIREFIFDAFEKRVEPYPLRPFAEFSNVQEKAEYALTRLVDTFKLIKKHARPGMIEEIEIQKVPTVELQRKSNLKMRRHYIDIWVEILDFIFSGILAIFVWIWRKIGLSRYKKTFKEILIAAGSILGLFAFIWGVMMLCYWIGGKQNEDGNKTVYGPREMWKKHLFPSAEQILKEHSHKAVADPEEEKRFEEWQSRQKTTPPTSP